MNTKHRIHYYTEVNHLFKINAKATAIQNFSIHFTMENLFYFIYFLFTINIANFIHFIVIINTLLLLLHLIVKILYFYFHRINIFIILNLIFLKFCSVYSYLMLYIYI
jgi:hypothetical protein